MTVPFSLPLIDQPVIDEVNDCLTNTGWLTSGPKVLQLEAEIRLLTGVPAVVCVNSWTSGAMLMLRWYGVSVWHHALDMQIHSMAAAPSHAD